jgi:large subunit ribosomal protein L19
VQNAIIAKINQATVKKRPRFSVGDRVSVSVRLKEGDKERVQIFRGVVICKSPKSGNGPGATFTVRKISSGVGVERVFPLHSPAVEKIAVESSATVRRSRLYYLRDLSGKKARLKESAGFEDLVTEGAPVAGNEASTTEANTEKSATETAKASGAKAEDKKA